MITALAHAKINWALDILSTLNNGYHEMDMLMQSVTLHDTLAFEEAEDVTLLTDGAPDPYGEENLIVRAARLLQTETGCTKGAKIALEKRMPAMAGMGGGSADCAAAMRALNILWGLAIPEKRLLELGFSLGADVAFCLVGGLQRVRGMGERLEGLNAPPSPEMVILMPDEGLSTGAVFGEYDRGMRTMPRVDMDTAQEALLAGDYAALDRLAGNALTEPAVHLSGAIEPAIQELRALGAVMARMSGSGTAVFGVFMDAAVADAAQAALSGKYTFCERAGTNSTGVTLKEES